MKCDGDEMRQLGDNIQLTQVSNIENISLSSFHQIYDDLGVAAPSSPITFEVGEAEPGDFFTDLFQQPASSQQATGDETESLNTPNFPATAPMQGCGEVREGSNAEEVKTSFGSPETAFNNQLMYYKLDLKEERLVSLEDFYHTYRQDIERIIDERLASENMRPVRFSMEITTRMSRTTIEQTGEGQDEAAATSEVINNFGMQSGVETIMPTQDRSIILNKIFDKFSVRISNFLENGSNWNVDGVLHCGLKFTRFEMNRAGCYNVFESLSKHILNKRVLVSVKSEDHRCFLYSILAAYECKNNTIENFNDYLKKNWERLVKEHRLNIKDLEFPTTVDQVKKFSRIRQLPLVLLMDDNDEFVPFYVSEHKSNEMFDSPVYLLYLQDDERGTGHYCCVRKIEAL